MPTNSIKLKILKEIKWYDRAYYTLSKSKAKRKSKYVNMMLPK